MKDMEQKVLVNVAPVAATDKVIIPEKIAEDVYECYKADTGHDKKGFGYCDRGVHRRCF